MKIYLAGTSVSDPLVEKNLRSLFRKTNKLHSYYHIINNFEKKWFEQSMKSNINLFLDSGAFSAFTQNVKIEIIDYCNFIKENNKKITIYSNLDVIGDPIQTYKNQKIMEAQGLTPIPVFHYGEDYVWLEKYLNEGYEYISLGGMVPISNKSLVIWLDNLFSNYLTDKEGLPKVKVHGFGLTSFSLMFRYPWYSVDSTSWVVTGRLGSIFIPIFKGGKWIYSRPPLKIAVSSKSPKLKEAGQHLNTLSPNQQQVFIKYLKENGYELGSSVFKMEQQTYQLKENEKWVGKKPKDKNKKRQVEVITQKGVSNTYQLRDELNVLYYINLEQHFKKWPWKFKKEHHQKSLF
jgi:hypothetical protein